MRGDELLSINGQSVTDLPLDEVWRTMSLSAPEQHLALKLRRDGTIYATELKVEDPAAPQQVWVCGCVGVWVCPDHFVSQFDAGCDLRDQCCLCLSVGNPTAG